MEKPLVFQSTCHMRGMTYYSLTHSLASYISIHMPHAWHDPPHLHRQNARRKFQSTCHMRGMTSIAVTEYRFITYFNPHATCVAWLGRQHLTPHDEKDFNPHATCVAWLCHACEFACADLFQSTCHMRGMTSLKPYTFMHCSFQSTCHMRGMTIATRSRCIVPSFQSTCHMRGMTLTWIPIVFAPEIISIHMPHAWHDSRINEN